MVFRFLYPCLIAATAVFLLACLSWQSLLLVFLMGGIGWGLWTIKAGSRAVSDNTVVRLRTGRVAGTQTGPRIAAMRREGGLYHLSNRSRFAAK